MLDQSFSSHNFDIIYGIESRKGKIDIKSMPNDYQTVVSKIEETKSAIRNLKKNKDEESLYHIQKHKERLLVLNETKKVLLYDYLNEMESTVNTHLFRFEMEKFTLKEENKETFRIKTYLSNTF